LTPLGTALTAAVMTTAILTVHIRKGIWNADGGFEFPLVLLTMTYLVSALGPGSFSIDSLGRCRQLDRHPLGRLRHRPRWRRGRHRAAAGLLTLASALARKAWDAGRHAPSAAH